MTVASKAVEKYTFSKSYEEKLELSLSISLMVRIAETSFYNNFTKIFIAQ